MNRRLVVIAGFLVLLAGVGAGVYQFTGSRSPAAVSPTPGLDPERGLSAEQIFQQHRQLEARNDAKQAAFVTDFVRRGRDPRALPQVAVHADTLLGLPDLLTVIADSDLIVVGTVTRSAFRFTIGSHLADQTVHVERVLKGGAGAKLLIRQGGGPGLDGADNREVLFEYQGDPLLLSGDRALLFLTLDPSVPNAYTIINDGGQYRLEASRAVPQGTRHRFLAEVTGLSETQLVERVAQQLPYAGHRHAVVSTATASVARSPAPPHTRGSQPPTSVATVPGNSPTAVVPTNSTPGLEPTTSPFSPPTTVASDGDDAAPTVTHLSATSYLGSSGPTLVVSGTGFGTETTTHILFGTTPARVENCTATSCAVLVPQGYGQVDVRTNVNGQTSAISRADQFTYIPAVLAIDPAIGSVFEGTTVTVAGDGYDPAPGATRIFFGDTEATVVSCISFRCTAISPAGSGVVAVTVHVAGQTSALSKADRFTFICTAPSIAADSTSPRASGTTITFTSSATCSGAPSYRYWIRDLTGGWYFVQDYGADAAFTWATTGMRVGTYWIEVDARSEDSVLDQETYTVQSFTLK